MAVFENTAKISTNPMQCLYKMKDRQDDYTVKKIVWEV